MPIDDTTYGDIDVSSCSISNIILSDKFVCMIQFLCFLHLKDSFVVRSDEEFNKDESEEEMCELERAEMILKQQRQLKRKKNSQSGNADVKRRRRIIVGSSDSE